MTLLRQALGPVSRVRADRRRTRIEIGLLNNMGDQALKATERQFGSLVAEAADHFDLRLHVFAFEGTRRSDWARDYIAGRYQPARAIMRSELHALIITGAQPQAHHLSEEPYWAELVELIEWAKANTISTILSCLAAHAGVLHLDQIKRQPLAEKCTGVFAFMAKRTHPLVGRRGETRLIPHSRYNGLPESELERAGYEVLTSSPTHGVDVFTKSFGSEFVFLQGHPEYDANSLAREYRRDIDLYLRRETERKPARPRGYFGALADAELGAMERRADEDRGCAPVDHLSVIDSLTPAESAWRGAAVSFYRSWIATIANVVGRDRAPSLRMETSEFVAP